MLREKISWKILKKHLWWIVPLAGVFVLLLVQIFWPSDFARPFSKIGDRQVRLKNKSEVAGEYLQEEFSKAQIILSLEKEEKEFELASLGASVRTDFIDLQIWV